LNASVLPVKLIHNGNDSSFTVITSTASGGGAFLSVVDSSFGSSLQEERKRLAAKQASVRSLIMMDPFLINGHIRMDTGNLWYARIL
jgi:hypothetical protein